MASSIFHYIVKESFFEPAKIEVKIQEFPPEYKE